AEVAAAAASCFGSPLVCCCLCCCWRWFYPDHSILTQLEPKIRADPVQTSSNQIKLELTGQLNTPSRLPTEPEIEYFLMLSLDFERYVPPFHPISGSRDALKVRAHRSAIRYCRRLIHSIERFSDGYISL
ncbi:Uncharacterized protein APZ42_002580, partial [Daphnia magna]